MTEPTEPASADREPAPDLVALVRAAREATIPGSPIAQDAAALAHFDFVFLPALIAALKKG